MLRFAPPPTQTRRRRRFRRPAAAASASGSWVWGRLALGVVAATGMAGTRPAVADDPESQVLSVLQRAIDADAASGMRVGSAIVTPSIEVDGTYDTNIFASNHNAHGDWFTSIIPGVDIESDLPRHAFSLRAQGEVRQFATFDRENTGDISVEGTGRIDLAPNAYVLAGGGYQLLHEDRGALVPVQGVSPTQFTVTSGKSSFVVEPAPLGLRLDLMVDSYGYNNVALPNGGVVPETARDHVTYALAPRMTYQIVSQYNAFIGAVVNRREYNSTHEPDGVDRSSTGYQVDLGTSFKVPGFAAGEIYAGYLSQDYDSHLVSPLSAVDFGGKLEWRPDDDTSVRFELRRSIEESSILGSPGYLQTAVRLGIEEALQPRFIVHGSIGYINADFAGAGGSSDLYEAKVGARYVINTNLLADLEYTYGLRASTSNLPRFTRQIVELRLRGQL
ncbi:MAG: outer membrane beta-barrel protein [Alphaproteobacteria bacterium]|nr:outer membrane beta-barrel protein [Alphaproteobacteria bacterium]